MALTREQGRRQSLEPAGQHVQHSMINGHLYSEYGPASTATAASSRQHKQAIHMNGASSSAKYRSRREPWWVWFILALVIGLTWLAYPPNLQLTGQSATVRHVFFYGWITAISTGFGILPFYLVSHMSRRWLGISNATAAGMMLAASTSLVLEGVTAPTNHAFWIPQWLRVLAGLLGGLAFIVSTKSVLEQHEELKVAGLDGLEARKVLLLIFVMTLHSFTEGVGIGVSFGGDNGSKLGRFISLSLAAHNVPEGLAVSLVLAPRGVSKLKTALWCIFTSIPQPLMAVPAFLFVASFEPFLPIGLGFAAGAMLWVALFELMEDAFKDTGSRRVTMAVMAFAGCMMMRVQQVLKDT